MVSGASSSRSSATQNSCQPRNPATTSPRGRSARREAITSPTPIPRITSPTGTDGMNARWCPSQIRLAASTDSTSVRTRAWPSCNGAMGSVTSSRSLVASAPAGRRRSRHPRFMVAWFVSDLGHPCSSVNVSMTDRRVRQRELPGPEWTRPRPAVLHVAARPLVDRRPPAAGTGPTNSARSDKNSSATGKTPAVGVRRLACIPRAMATADR